MSALAGCYWFDRPARPEDVAPAVESAAHRAGGPFRIETHGCAALAHADDPRSPHTFPFHDIRLETTVVLDGRLDNLSEIAQALDVPSGCPTGALLLAAFRRWGVDACVRLLGEFVLVVYDGRYRRLTCVRDPIGQRPFFYGIGSRGVVFGSEAQQVVRHPQISREINEGMVAEYLADAPTTTAETLWRHVRRLPPAHALEIAPSGHRIWRYWNFDPEARVRYRVAGQYAEHFRELFTRAVACRLVGADRQPAHAGVLLSGGIDSSSIACVAQSIRQTSGGPPIQAFSATFPGRPCDETPYIDAVVHKWRLPATRADLVLPSRGDLEREVDRYLDPFASPGLTADVLRRLAVSQGVEVLLTGCGGDDYFSGSSLGLLRMLRQGQMLGAARAVVSPWLSDRTRSALRPLFGARLPEYPWIRSEFRAKAGLDERLRPAAVPPFPTREQRDLYRIVTGLPQIIGDELEDRAAHAAGVIQRHPFYDRRVAEFGLALPRKQRADRGQHKIVIRQALKDVLPERVAARPDKAEFSFTYVEALQALGGEQLFRRLRSEEAGWVNGDALRSMYGRLSGLYSSGGEAYIQLIAPLWTVAALEMWLDRVR